MLTIAQERRGGNNGVLAAGHRRSSAAPPAALRNDRRTAGLLARGVSPTPPSRISTSSGEKSVGTPLTVAGAAADRRKAYRVPFSPSNRRGTVLKLMFQLH
jgi:hypothetical protein